MSTALLEGAASVRARRSSRWWWERGILVSTLLIVTLLAWLELGRMQMQTHAGTSFPLLLALWSLMMVAMMLPAASPMILTYASVSGRNGGPALQRTLVFSAAYLAVWAVGSAAGALVQLIAISSHHHASVFSTSLFSAGALLGAGAWQLSPMKHACLRRCRTPLGFLITEWRSGARGALVMGARHGTDCVLCCWALMTVMLLLGAMNLPVMAALTALMMAEKIAPGGHHIARTSALVLMASGGWQLARIL